MNELARIKNEAWRIVSDPRSNRIEKLEGLKLIAASKGILLPEIDERWLSVKQVVQLRAAKRDLAEKVLKQKERRRRANRKQYLKRRISQLEADQKGE